MCGGLFEWLDLIRAARHVVSLKHRCGLVTADGHGDGLRHTGADQGGVIMMNAADAEAAGGFGASCCATVGGLIFGGQTSRLSRA